MSETDKVIEEIYRLVNDRVENLMFSRVGETKYKRKTLDKQGIDDVIHTIHFLQQSLVDSILHIDFQRELADSADHKIDLLTKLALSCGASPLHIQEILNFNTTAGITNDTQH